MASRLDHLTDRITLIGGDMLDSGSPMRAIKVDEPRHYVIATGESHSVQEPCDAALSRAGLDYRDHVRVNENFLRPADVPALRGRIRARAGPGRGGSQP